MCLCIFTCISKTESASLLLWTGLVVAVAVAVTVTVAVFFVTVASASVDISGIKDISWTGHDSTLD